MFEFAKPKIARVSTVKHPNDRVEVCEDLDVVCEVVKLWALVCLALCDSCAKRMLVFTIYTRGAVKFKSAIVCVNLVGLLVVSDELVRDDD